jgi:hypothetical protein
VAGAVYDGIKHGEHQRHGEAVGYGRDFEAVECASWAGEMVAAGEEVEAEVACKRRETLF